MELKSPSRTRILKQGIKNVLKGVHSMIDPIFNMFKTKFSVMDGLQLLDKDADRIDIYINLENVFKVLLSPRVNNYLMTTIEDNNQFKIGLMSNIVNLAQHYRLYCSKYRKDSRVFLYWNYPKSEYKNSEYICGYREYYNHKMFKNEGCDYIIRNLNSCLDFMKKLFNYINQIYLIDGGVIDSSVVPYLVEEHIYQSREDKDVQKIIVSNAKYDFQYVSYGFTILETNKDDSCIICEDNVIDILKERMGIKNSMTIPPNLIPFTISLLGDRYRNIPKLSGVGLSSILKMINKAIEELIITDQTKDVDMLSQIIAEKYRSQFISNYLCTYIPRQYDELKPLEILSIENQIVDKFDDNALALINERYFRSSPLMTIKTKTEQAIDQIHHSIWDKKH